MARPSLVRSLLHRPEPAPPDPRTSRARLILCALSLAAAAVLLTLGSALQLDTSDDAARQVAQIADDRSRFLVSGILWALGAGALVPGALALASLVRGRGAGWMTTGAAMTALGGGGLALAIWSYTIVGFVGTADDVPAGATTVLLDKAQDHVLVGLPWVIGIGGLVGMMVAAVGLIRARAVPLWLAVLFLVSPVPTFLSGPGPLSLLLNLPLTVAMIGLAVEAVRHDRRRLDVIAERTATASLDEDVPEMPAQRNGRGLSRRRSSGPRAAGAPGAGPSSG